MTFKKWFNKKLEINAFPYRQNHFYGEKKYDICINMSDEWYFDTDQKIKETTNDIFWFPMNEAKSDTGINSLYGAMIILYNAYKENKKVYLHCHAGINRSQATADAFWFMMLGTQRETHTNGFINQLTKMSGYGYLPEKIKVENFLLNIKKVLDSDIILGGQLDKLKIYFL